MSFNNRDYWVNVFEKLKHEHGLKNWHLTFKCLLKVNGLTHNGEICLASYLVDYASKEYIYNTLLHEIAHAIVGEHHGHDEVWSAKAQELGYRGSLKLSRHLLQPVPYEMVCACGYHESKKFKRQLPILYPCKKCKSYLEACAYSEKVFFMKSATGIIEVGYQGFYELPDLNNG